MTPTDRGMERKQVSADSNPHAVRVGQVWADSHRRGHRVGVRSLCADVLCDVDGRPAKPHAHVVGFDSNAKPTSRKRVPLDRFNRYYLLNNGL